MNPRKTNECFRSKEKPEEGSETRVVSAQNTMDDGIPITLTLEGEDGRA